MIKDIYAEILVFIINYLMTVLHCKLFGLLQVYLLLIFTTSFNTTVGSPKILKSPTFSIKNHKSTVQIKYVLNWLNKLET